MIFLVQSHIIKIMSVNLQVDIMLHESHPGISGPAFLVVVAHDVLVVGVRVFRQVALDQVTCLLCREPKLEKHQHARRYSRYSGRSLQAVQQSAQTVRDHRHPALIRLLQHSTTKSCIIMSQLHVPQHSSKFYIYYEAGQDPRFKQGENFISLLKCISRDL